MQFVNGCCYRTRWQTRAPVREQPVLDQLDGLHAAVDALRQHLVRSPGPTVSPLSHPATAPPRRRRRGSGSTACSEAKPQPILTPLASDAATEQRKSSLLPEWAAALENPLTPPLLKLAAWFDGGDAPSPGPASLTVEHPALPAPSAPATPNASHWSWAAAAPSGGGLAAANRRRSAGSGGGGGEMHRGAMHSELVWRGHPKRPGSPALSLVPSATSSLTATASAAVHHEQTLEHQSRQTGFPRGVRAKSQPAGGGGAGAGSGVDYVESFAAAGDGGSHRGGGGSAEQQLQLENDDGSSTASGFGVGGGGGNGQGGRMTTASLQNEYDMSLADSAGALRDGGVRGGGGGQGGSGGRDSVGRRRQRPQAGNNRNGGSQHMGGGRAKDDSEGDFVGGGPGGSGSGGGKPAGMLKVRRDDTTPKPLRPDLSSAQPSGAAASDRRRRQTLHVSTSVRQEV